MKWNSKNRKIFLEYFCKKYEEQAIKNATKQRYVGDIKRLCKESFFNSKFPDLFENSKKILKIGNEFSSYTERVEYVIDQLQSDLEKRYPKENYRGDNETAIRRFSEFIWSFFDGSCFADVFMLQMNISTTSPKELLAQIVAGTSIMLPGPFIDKIKTKRNNVFANASGKLKYYRNNKIPKGNKGKNQLPVIKGGYTYENLIPDDNTYANTALKRNILKCIGLPASLYTLFVNYTACHIWAYPDDPRYYDNLQNLALVPSFLAGLTDHDEFIKTVLQKRAFDLYGFCEYYPSAVGASDPNSQCNKKMIKNNISGYPTGWRSL